MSSNFEKVSQFMQSAGQVKKSINNLTEDQINELKKFRTSLIEEEFNELKDAFKKNDRMEVIDALVDILYVVYGTGVAFEIELDEAFKIVHDSNMSKFCKTEEEAKETVEYYKNTSKIYDSPAYRWEQGFYVVYNESTGKILKSVNYTPAKFPKTM
jgi:predicted HAD superfamily Cof-like phosphohydrolase